MRNQELPKGIARDKNLKETTDPFKAACLESIGNHKGFALAFMVEMLTSGLTGQNHSVDLLPMYGTSLKKNRGVSHTFIMIDPQFLGENTLNSLKNILNRTYMSVSPNQLNLLPGMKELNTKKKREKEGIPILREILKGWEEIGF